MKSALVGVLLIGTLAACSSSGNDDKPHDDAPRTPSATGCTDATAIATTRTRITHSGLDHACVKVARKASFTLVNADSAAHDFSTTKTSPTQLRVQLKKAAAFPYTFKKAGTYMLEDSRSDLVLTIIVD